ncbi:MAG: hypothetical protein Q4Q06_07865, partial [Bacteroidota bacterium]|nr:hypothetical protein [Bacteroidota bacterium]
KEESVSLFSKWQLKEFVSNDFGIKIPSNSNNNVYWIKINKDYSFEGQSYSNKIYGNISVNTFTNELTFTKIDGTEIAELFDGELFVEKLYKINKYEFIKDTLKLFYNDNQNYLKFKKGN